jgi:hypothetical protein
MGMTGGWELIRDETISKNTTSFTLSGLNGDSDILYLLLVHYRNPTGEGVCCDIRFNNDSGKNYNGIVTYSDGSVVATTVRNNRSELGFVGAIGTDSGSNLNIGWGSALIYAKSGTPRTVLIDVYEPTARLDFKGWHWDNASDNITSMVLVANSAGRDIPEGIGAGTRILLFRMKGPTI